jgi:hypothetical protein
VFIPATLEDCSLADLIRAAQDDEITGFKMPGDLHLISRRLCFPHVDPMSMAVFLFDDENALRGGDYA